MKIGILTFHWATNYGAILQAYALQTYIEKMGHEVEIINYKPKQFDYNLWNFLRFRKFLNISAFVLNVDKEREMEIFRMKYLTTTKRYFTLKELREKCNNFDVLISGSDQVLNSSFLQYGEAGRSTAYYLDFGSEKVKRVFYAVSFGITEYPKSLSNFVRPIVARINMISVRERTGKNIFSDMGRNDTCIVPDPTILLENSEYLTDLKIKKSLKRSDVYFVYMLHGKLSKIREQLPQNINISKSETIENWIEKINNAKGIITNSFHGTVFCILSHTPFSVVLPTKENLGMNDRFFTMLEKLGLEDRITTEAEFKITDIDKPINWEIVEILLNDYRCEGKMFLQKAINK